MAVQVITREYGYVVFSTGDSFTVGDGAMLTVYDEGGEPVGAFAQWIGILKTDS